ncbi:MAG: hypothetical protein R3244_01540 [Thermoanaerobaculia bacterium]|nr:hypothetical protein [Thermoanaerobaculia bacterium]
MRVLSDVRFGIPALALAALVLSSCAVYRTSPPGGEKVLVCHKGKKTLEIAPAALDAHLRHGDRRGACR